jgi:hypothetical protein
VGYAGRVYQIEASQIILQNVHHHHHHQLINVPTAGSQAFLMDYTLGEQAKTHHVGPVRVGGRQQLQMLPGPTS